MRSSETPPLPQSSYPTLVGLIGMFFIAILVSAIDTEKKRDLADSEKAELAEMYTYKGMST